MSIRVVVADDHPAFRFGLHALLDQADDVVVVGEAADGDELLRLVRDHEPDVVVTDLAMAGVDGTHVIRVLAASQPQLPVIALTMHSDDDYVRDALRAGARGYLLKGADGEDTARAVRAVHAGGDAYDPAITRRLVTAFTERAPDNPGLPRLTPREREVLALIAEGRRNADIARGLAITEKTVRNVTSSVLLKLGVPDRTAAALRAQEAGLGKRSHRD